jgi:hypothetical protein
MESFDFFGEILFDEAKFLYEKALESKYNKEKQLYLQSSLLMGMSALEAYVNAVCEELVGTEEYKLELYEKMLLSEKKIELKNGIASLGNQLQMSRLIDRIEYIYCRFSHKQIDQNDRWHDGIHEAINLRNSLVHPKEVIILNTEQIERALSNILQTVNAIFYAVYKRNVPILNYGLQSVKNYRE